MSAAALHQQLFKIDTHLDTPTASLVKPGWDFGASHESAGDGSQCDLPRMRAGGIDAVVFAAYSAQNARTPEGFALAHERLLRVLQRTREVVAAHDATCGLAATAADGRALKAAGRHAIYLSIENSYPLGRDAGRVADYSRLGVRMLGLTHMLNNDVADSSTDPRGPEWGGLSPFGREVVAECDRLGLLVDASHASDDALRDLLECSRAPVILSHSGCRAVCDHPRNIGDDLLRALARRGGVIQINALPVAVVAAPDDGRADAFAALQLQLADRLPTPETAAWASGEWHRLEAAFPNPAVTLDDYVRHLEHAVAVAGIDHVGIGCDFDGGGGFPGLHSVADYPHLTAALVARGWSEEALAKVWGENTLRLLG